MTTTTAFDENPKYPFLVAVYQSFWQEMSWRRTAGYRTIILGLAYCTALLAAVALTHGQMPNVIRYTLSGVIALATVFGSGYLAANYKKYMAAAARLVAIEEFFGAYRPDFLEEAGALMPQNRRHWPSTPLVREPVSFLSIIAFLVGGLLTAAAIFFV